MKLTKRLSLTLAALLALLMALSLTACSSYAPPPQASSAEMLGISPDTGGNDVAVNSSTAENGFINRVMDVSQVEESAAPAEPSPAPAPVAAAPNQPVDQPRKLVKHGQLDLETKEFDTAIASLIQTVESVGGYIDRQSVDGKSLRNDGDYYERSASITARIPADKLDSVTQQIGTLCNIVSQSQNVNDITDNYYDAQSRLDMLQVKETRLLDLLSKAEKLEDVIKLEDALSTCQYELDSLTGQLRRMDSQVSYSTLNLRLNEVVEYQDMVAAPATFGEKLTGSFSRSGKRLLRSMESTLLGVIESGPVLVFNLVIWGGILYLCYWLLRKRLRKQRKAVAAPVPAVSADPAPDTSDE